MAPLRCFCLVFLLSLMTCDLELIKVNIVGATAVLVVNEGIPLHIFSMIIVVLYSHITFVQTLQLALRLQSIRYEKKLQTQVTI